MIATFTLNAAIDRTLRVEHLEEGVANRGTLTAARAGGKGINVASVAHSMGQEVIVSGFVGGYAGRFIEDYIVSAGMDHDFVPIQAESRNCIAILDSGTGTITEVNEAGPEVDFDALSAMERKVEDLAGRCGVCVFSGSLPRGCPHDYYARLIKRARKQGAFVVLDTSGPALRAGIQAEPDLIKPNEHEIKDLLGFEPGSEPQLIEALQGIRKEWAVDYIIVTLGSEGAICATPAGFLRVRVPKLPVVNTVGCGDAFVAGMCVGYERSMPPGEFIRLGAAAASAKLGSKDAGTCDPREVRRLVDEVCVESIVQAV